MVWVRNVLARRLVIVHVGQGVQVFQPQIRLPPIHLPSHYWKYRVRGCPEQRFRHRRPNNPRFGNWRHSQRLRHYHQPRVPSQITSHADWHLAIFIVSTILGPLIGGAFTTGVTWRWCFWINLPLGGPVIVLVSLFVHIPKHAKPTPATWKEILLHLDIPGFAFLLDSVVCLALALQQGGQTQAWSAGSTIALLVLWPVFTIIFFVIEKLQGELAMVPLRLLRPRVTWANALYCYLYVPGHPLVHVAYCMADL